MREAALPEEIQVHAPVLVSRGGIFSWGMFVGRGEEMWVVVEEKEEEAKHIPLQALPSGVIHCDVAPEARIPLIAAWLRS